MAISVLTNASVNIGGVDLSDHVRQVTVTMTSEDVDITAMGSTARNHAPGLRDDAMEFVVFQDHASSSVDQTLSGYVGVQAGATIIVAPVATTISATNPKYTMVGVLLDYSPIDGEVGAASTTTVRFVPAQGGKITRSTT